MSQSHRTWIEKWIDAVANGSTTMSQRRLRSVERNGGTAAAIAAANERGVHLAKLTDEKETFSLPPVCTQSCPFAEKTRSWPFMLDLPRFETDAHSQSAETHR